MNVLLAEADVDYSKLIELDEANEDFKSTDVAVIIGANDVVNPDAIDDTSSPLYGMPILKVWDSTSTVVLKRGMSAGYAGVQNPLFFRENNKMYFCFLLIKFQSFFSIFFSNLANNCAVR